MPDQFSDVHRSISPSSAVQQQVILFCPFTNAHGLNVWRWWLLVKFYVLAVGNAVWGWQSCLKQIGHKIQIAQFLFQSVIEKIQTHFKCQGASFLFFFSFFTSAPLSFQMRALSMPASQADLEVLALQQELALHAHQSYQSGYKQPQDKAFRNR